MWLRKGLILFLLAALLGSLSIVTAQDSNATTMYELNMRTGPGTGYDLVTIMAGGTPLVLEARDESVSWVLAHTPDGAYRGWLAAIYIVYGPGYSAAALPVSSEVVSGAPAPAPAAPEQPAAPVESSAAASPPDAVSAYTTYDMNVRGGPGTTYQSIGQLVGGAGVVLEARNTDSSWVLVHTPEYSLRGWVASLYLRFTMVSASSLPLSAEIVAAPDVPIVADPENPGASTTYPGFDVSRVQGIDLTAYPIVGQATGNARSIFIKGQAAGRNRNYVSKIGDCFTDHEYFLRPFSWDKYNLGDYASLQGVLDHFKDSLDDYSYGASVGFLAGAVLDRMWADPSVCITGESPLQCEYRVHNSSAAIIMFGTQDMLLMTPEQFDFYLREVVRFTIADNVIPILSTFPGNTGQWDQTVLYNQIVVRIALDYDVPLMNLWLALEDLPNHGLDETGNHLSMPTTLACDLSYPNLDQGYPMRNLVTMQTLNAVWLGAMQ